MLASLGAIAIEELARVAPDDDDATEWLPRTIAGFLEAARRQDDGV